ncbi:MAG TPA: hypothetical protein VGK74_26205 [Symbiobacteriaceae bacterium]
MTLRASAGLAFLLAFTLGLGSACSRTPALLKKDDTVPHRTQEVAPAPAKPDPAKAGVLPWSYTALDFRDDQKGWVAALGGTYGAAGLAGAESGLWRTADGGKTWSAAVAPKLTVSRLVFTDETHGLAMGTTYACQTKGGNCQLYIAATTDSAATWAARWSADLPGGIGDNPPLLKMLNANEGYALYVGASERFLLLTFDGGKTWNPAGELGEGYLPDGVSFVDRQRGWAIGRACQTNGAGDACKYAVFATTDSGTTWNRVFDLPAGRRHRAGTIDFVDANRGWLYPTADTAFCSMGGCAGPLYRTDDGGKTWTDLKWKETKHTDQGMVGFPRGVTFVGPNRGWMLVEAGAGSGVGGIGVTLDGGVTWDRYAPAGVRTFSLLSPTTDQVAWAVGGPVGDPTTLGLMRTTDGAKTWTPVAPPFPVAKPAN